MEDKTVLIVDLVGLSRGKLKKNLESGGYVVVESTSSGEAVQMLSDIHVDMIISDLKLPPRDGFDLFERALAEGRIKMANGNAKPPFLIKTGRISEEIAENAERVGITGVVPESITAGDLLLRVGDLIGPAKGRPKVKVTESSSARTRASRGHKGMNEYRVTELRSPGGESVSHYELSGSISKGSGFTDLAHELIADLQHGRPNAIFNLAEVNYINSSGIAGLVALNKEIAKVGGRIHLVALQEPIARVFENLSLFKVFPLHETLEDALSRIREGG